MQAAQPMYEIDDGTPTPLGATWDGRGVNFALFSRHATAVDLCLFEPTGQREVRRIRLPFLTEHVWHGYMLGLYPGQLYGYRVHGPYEPNQGHRFNPNKLLIDPYAHQLFGRVRWHDAVFGYRVGSARADLTMDRRDSARLVPKSVVGNPAHHWGADAPPYRRWKDTVIYEAHVKGFTVRHPDLPPAIRGTYEGLGHPRTIDHLVRLGITAVELLPIHAFVDDRFIVERGLRNYWGYSTLAFFAPEPRYYGPAGTDGLRAAIHALHDAGIEVILDVVYNHTAEGNEMGPTLSLRGIDNASYYRLSPHDPRHCYDTTGTGNSLNLSHPRVLQMVMDSLRHWVQSYHVDGFRFDLASTLTRDPYDVSDRAGFLHAVQQDPVLGRVKLIAEPWDVGHGGYRLGGFPPGFGEWNDRFRDTVRSFWRGDPEKLPPIGDALAGSALTFRPSGRHPWASVNYVCSHDGYTLQDLVSYEHRHNEANGEDNRDGHTHNLSWNGGVEGPTDDPAILALRARQKRNMIATLLFSQGTPMLLMGDELSRTQGGNNNAYAQDNETSWVDWEARTPDPEFCAFVREAIALRRRFDAFRRHDFFAGHPLEPNALKDVYWLAPDGREMTEADWDEDLRRTLGVQFGNDAKDGERFLLVLNASPENVDFRLPPDFPGETWIAILDTRLADGVVREEPTTLRADRPVTVEGRSLLLFRHTADGQAHPPAHTDGGRADRRARAHRHRAAGSRHR